ncbi:response regulator [Sediminicola sp. 1XM1-17]|uniref:response regulator n=1 Tax=Sediminicola sp. 1XM1-17 TaxID=3127702 RepID=UPI003077263C
MDKDKRKYNLLVIEDNPGDLVLVEEYLDEHILDPKITNAENFKEAKDILVTRKQTFDVILLDLSLPDKNGEELVREMLLISAEIPIIILTGYTDMPFSVRSIQLGISDYLVKDILSPLALYQSILHNIDRKKFITDLKQSKKRYNDLFQLSPQPMWVYDTETLKFLDVNESAVNEYGYSLEEFLEMTVTELFPKEKLHILLEHLKKVQGSKDSYRSLFGQHQLKNGKIIDVEVHSKPLMLDDKKSQVVLANNVTERTLYIKAIEDQNEKLQEIAWIQSHIVRAPLARLMGLMNLIKDDIPSFTEDQSFYLNEILNSANELDSIIKEISLQASEVKIEND